MGLSSSQARLLSLTGRMHDIEYKAQKLEAQKLQMANESAHVYQEYENALNRTKIQLKQMGSDGSTQFIDATYNNLIAAGYKLSSSGAIAVSKTDLDYFNTTADGNAIEFACLKSGYCQKSGNKIVLSSDTSKVCIFTQAQLKAQAGTTDTKVLMTDINVTESMGTLKGTLDGNGHTLTSTVKNTVFTTLSGATVKNINLVFNNSKGGLANTATGNTNIENVNLSGVIDSSSLYNNVGGLIGTSKGTTIIKNITSNTDVKGNSSTIAGGLVGQNNGGQITFSNANVTGNISGGNQVGGILGGQGWYSGNPGDYNNISATISNVSFEGSVNAQKGIAGGLVGVSWANLTIENSCSDASVEATNTGVSASAGGIVGSIQPKTSEVIIKIDNCYSGNKSIYAKGTTDNYNYAGSIIGSVNAASQSEPIVEDCTSYNDTLPIAGASLDNNLKQPATLDTDIVNNVDAGMSDGASLSTEYSPEGTSGYSHYYEIGKAIESGNYFLVEGKENDSNWLSEMINSAFIILSKMDISTGEYYDVNVATDTSLQEVSDDTELKKAEAKYEADMRKINNKDKKFDTDLAALEQERNAIKTEMDTLKTVAKDNVDRTFKLFS